MYQLVIDPTKSIGEKLRMVLLLSVLQGGDA